MKKMMFIALGMAVLLAAGGGGMAAYLTLENHQASKPKPIPPKPIYFAQLDDLIVSVPADAGGQPGQAYVQFSVQFASTDQQAVAVFTALQPIIKSETITLLMTETAKQLMDPASHPALAKSCLAIANQVLNKSAAYTPPSPFTAAYITNIVQQD